MGFPRAIVFAGEIARRLADAASKSPPREPTVRIGKRQGMRSQRVNQTEPTWVRCAPREGPPFSGLEPLNPRSASGLRDEGTVSSAALPGAIRGVRPRTYAAILRRGDGCRVGRLLRSKKFRYSGRLGVLRSALCELLGQHRSHGSGSIIDAKNASTEVVFEPLCVGTRSASDAANAHPQRRA